VKLSALALVLTFLQAIAPKAVVWFVVAARMPPRCRVRHLQWSPCGQHGLQPALCWGLLYDILLAVERADVTIVNACSYRA
jgi:hypothetical protein